MSLLDKFIDPRECEHTLNAALLKTERSGESSQLKSILWNIQNILQTRRTAEVSGNVGLMDFCEQSLSEPLIHRLCGDIQQQIQQHEKRLCYVQVALLESTKTSWLISVAARLASKADSDAKGNVNFILELAKSA